MKVRAVRLLFTIPGEDPVFRGGGLEIDEFNQAVFVRRPDGSTLRLPLALCVVELEPEPETNPPPRQAVAEEKPTQRGKRKRL